MEEKIGLALSGGGFRAAFFHVGVLARLAELGILPRIEVISTVSGGSIVGAAYYLRLRRLLQGKGSDEIGGDDYLELVQDVDRMLRDAVRKHIRGRVFANPLKNLEMLLRPDYSRSDRIGDLYDRHLYKPAWGEKRENRSWGRQRQIEMRELLIDPHGVAGFDLESGNDERRGERGPAVPLVPALVVNATTLNTGHNWRFEAVRMGEPPPEAQRRAEIVAETDANVRLAPGYFPRLDRTTREPQVPEHQADFPLALAVAASACVPGAFHPLAISGMYRDAAGEVRVQLVDGGVQDNQGTQALLDRECSRLIVSDASGQLKDKSRPSSWFAAALLRSSGISRDRIRDEQLTSLPSDGRKYALMHLRKGLTPAALEPGPGGGVVAAEPAGEYPTTSAFGVDRDVQLALSCIRTDLDFFSDTEARSLELDAYLMSAKELELRGFEALGDPGRRPDGPVDWPFLALKPSLAAPDDAYLRKLEVGRRKFLRTLRLRPALATLITLIAVAVLAALVVGVRALVDALDLGLPGLLGGALLLAFFALPAGSAATVWTTWRYDD